MREAAPPPTTKAAVACLLVTCFLIVLGVNLLLANFLEQGGYNHGYRVIRDKWSKLQALTSPVDYLVLGDSSCNQGIDPAVLEERLGGRALNLCTIGDMTLVGDAWMLQDYLARFPPPKAVLLCHVYDVWQRSDRGLRAGVWNLDVAGVPWSGFDPPLSLSWREQIDRRVAPWLPTYSQNQTLIRLLTEPELRRRSPATITALGFQIELDSRVARVESDTELHLEKLASGEPFRLSAFNRQALDALGRLAEFHGLPVLYVAPPVATRLNQSFEYQFRQATIAATVDWFKQQYPHLEVLHVQPPDFPPHLMQNADHVTQPAATLYSEWLATQLLSRFTPR